MATQHVIIGGTDITRYLVKLRITKNDVDAPGSGRDLNGTMMRSRVATKAKLECECRKLVDEEVTTVSSAIAPQTVYVSYLDPYFGQRNNVEFYCSEFGSSVWRSDEGGKTYWEGIAFNLIEV